MLGGRRQPGDPLREDTLDAAAEWQRLWKRCQPRTLCGGQHRRELQQSERVTRRPGHQLVANPIGQPGSRLVEKCRGRRGLEAAQSPLRKTRGCEVAVVVIPRAEQQHDTLGLQPTRHKDQCVGRWPVKPLRVVDQTEEALAGRHLRDKGEHGDRDQKGVVAATGGEAERSAQRCRLRRRQRRKLVKYRIEQLM